MNTRADRGIAHFPSPVLLPPTMPRFADRTWRRIFRAWVQASGWRFEGALPNVPKAVLIAAPHTSWWDGYHGLLFKIALGADISFMAKRELFRGPPGWVLRKLGGIPIERHAAHGVIAQMVMRFNAHDQLWLGITPEGTRNRVARWKTGFWQIARGAGVPIVPVYFDYPRRIIGVGPLFMPSADIAGDMATLRALYAPFAESAPPLTKGMF
ncbi:MAG: lysophospholipid acyltransferase family protein [Rhodanobacteraceae bacterium]